jgi:hypothetical protein
MPKQNKTACKRRKCQRSRSQGRRRNNNRRTRTIRGGRLSPFRKFSEWNTARRTNAEARRAVGTETYQPARWYSPVRMLRERNNNRVVPESQIQQPSYNLRSVTNALYEEASAARRSIINDNKEILRLLQYDVSTATTKKDQDIKLQAVSKQQGIIRGLEREDARLRDRVRLPALPPDYSPNAALEIDRLSSEVDNRYAREDAAHRTARSALTNQARKVDDKMNALFNGIDE